MKLERSEPEGRQKLKIFNNLDDEYDPSDGCVLAVGNFDGVHKGHQLIFNTAVQTARDKGLKAVLLTFSRHPAALIRPHDVPQPLMMVPDRLILAERSGFDAALVLDFHEKLAALSPGKFVQQVLVDQLGIRTVVAGENWRFGRDRGGDMVMLESLGRRMGFEVTVVDPYMADDLPVSSTRIRGALAAGDVISANALLGRPHFVRGTVVGGKRRGRELGFPTVNLDYHDTMIPGEGVYAGGYLTHDAVAEPDGHKGGSDTVVEAFHGPAAISIGSSPTFENGSFAVEAHLTGWEGDLYGATVTIAFLDRLREQCTFSSGADLADQIALDVKESKGQFSVHSLEEIPF